jgi:hypothetical protein
MYPTMYPKSHRSDIVPPSRHADVAVGPPQCASRCLLGASLAVLCWPRLICPSTDLAVSEPILRALAGMSMTAWNHST